MWNVEFLEQACADVVCVACSFLKKEYGSVMMLVWALGLLAAGQSSTMTGTYTGQFVMSGFLDLHVSAWVRAAVTRGFALVPTLIVAVAYAGSNKMDKLNQALNVLQSMQLPFALVPVLYITSREDVMGERFKVKSVFKVVVYCICAALLLINLSVVASVLRDNLEAGVIAALLTVMFAFLYTTLVLYLIIGPREVYSALSRGPFPGAQWLAQQIGYEGVTNGLSDVGSPDACEDFSRQSDVLPLVQVQRDSLSSMDLPRS